MRAPGTPGRRPLLLAMLSVLAAPAGRAADTAASAVDDHPSAPAAGAEAPTLAARFEVRFTPRHGVPRHQRWQLERSPDRIVWIRGDHIAELWQREPGGVRLERRLLDLRHVVDYAPGELRALDAEPDWDELGRLIARSDLAALRPGPARDDTPGQHLSGLYRGGLIELVWDAALALPRSLRRQGPGGTLEIRCTDWHLGPVPPQWAAMAAPADTADWPRIDAADFGDMERHPVVRRMMARDAAAGWRPLHGPH